MTTLKKPQRRRPRQRPDLCAQAVVKLKPLQARRVEIIMDVLRQVDAHGVAGKTEARRHSAAMASRFFGERP